jgi:hypothetical protein
VISLLSRSFIRTIIISIIVLSGFIYFTGAQQDRNVVVADIWRVMSEHSGIAEESLWPGFNIQEIPVAVYDSINTWLFFSDNAPDGFEPVKGNSEVYIFKGQYPMVRGNSITRFGETWTATSILSNYSRRTNERYTAKDMAGIIIHEQFHIFQRTRHQGWRQNDGLLLFYPKETKDALFLRRVEKEAFKRAVLAKNKKEIVGWAVVAMDYRKERLGKVSEEYRNYEKQLQLTEGLSDYIERVARGLDPLNASNITNGIAPAGIRDLGYWEGRWIAMICDKLNPGWKMNLENNDTLFLEQILGSLLNDYSYRKKTFSKRELSIIKSEVEEDFKEWQLKTAEEVEKYRNLSGYYIEINSLSNPLNIRIFEPLEIEILSDGAVFHRVIFSAANERGSIRILNHPCITFFNESYRMIKLIIYGLHEAPEEIRNEKRIILQSGNITLELNYSEMKVNGSDYFIWI